MKIEETFTVEGPIEHVWQLITDPEIVTPCVPGCSNVKRLSDSEYSASVKVAIGPIKTRFNISVCLTEQTFPIYVASVTRGEEGGKASILNAHNELHLKAVSPGQTEIRYLSEVSLVGRLGKFGLGMMTRKARALGVEFSENFRNRVESATQEA